MSQPKGRYAVLDGDVKKAFISPGYNYVFDKRSGFFARWGETQEQDPSYSPFGPELLDLEISSGGDCLGNCPFCSSFPIEENDCHILFSSDVTALLSLAIKEL